MKKQHSSSSVPRFIGYEIMFWIVLVGCVGVLFFGFSFFAIFLLELFYDGERIFLFFLALFCLSLFLSFFLFFRLIKRFLKEKSKPMSILKLILWTVMITIAIIGLTVFLFFGSCFVLDLY